MRKSKCFKSNFSCQLCGNILPLARRSSCRRTDGHKKHLWCVKCKRITPHTELKECSSLAEFKMFYPDKEVEESELIDVRTKDHSILGRTDENYVAFMFNDGFIQVQSFYEVPDECDVVIMGVGIVGVFNKQGELINSADISLEHYREVSNQYGF